MLPQTANQRPGIQRPARSHRGSLGARSCGCMFKNPPGLHAGKLLDEAGLKGLVQGGARISEKHAAFFVNDGNATSRDFEHLIGRARDEIRRLHGLDLELELDVWY